MIKKSTTQNITSPKETKLDIKNVSLRPSSFKEYIGQKKIKENLSISIEAAKKRGSSLDHVLFYGPPGLGKTTLANILANELSVGLKLSSGPALDKPADIASILSNLNEGDIFFIDEIHRLRAPVEEVLYTAMEDFGIDIVIGKGPSARSMRLDIPNFTLIGATTKLSALSSPLRDRFGHIHKLDFYNNEEISEILVRAAKKMNIDILDNATELLAKCCRHTPRIALRLLKKVRDYAEIKNNGKVDKEIIENVMKLLSVDNIGLDKNDRNLLEIIIKNFNGGPVGLNTLAAALSEEENTIEDIYEPFLMKLGMLERTARGRMVTKKAYEHIGVII